MPVTKSAKKALRTAERRHEENLIQREAYKKAVKSVKKAVAAGTDGVAALLSQAQSALDTAAKKHTIHPNKAARLKSRLAKRLAAPVVAAPVAPVKKAAVKRVPKPKAATPAA